MVVASSDQLLFGLFAGLLLGVLLGAGISLRMMGFAVQVAWSSDGLFVVLLLIAGLASGAFLLYVLG